MQALKKYTEECNDEGSLIDNKITVKVDGKEYGLSAEIDIHYSIRELLKRRG